MNERYQKHTAPAGKTRKSAAAAKPKRPTSSGSSGSKKGSSAGKGGATQRQRIPLHPPTPEYRFWRRIWWGLIIISFMFVAASLWVMRNNAAGGWYLTIATYVILGAAVLLDFLKIRKIRMAWIESGGKLPEDIAKPTESTDGDAESSSASDKS